MVNQVLNRQVVLDVLGQIERHLAASPDQRRRGTPIPREGSHNCCATARFRIKADSATWPQVSLCP
jgi:hypothetical protein